MPMLAGLLYKAMKDGELVSPTRIEFGEKKVAMEVSAHWMPQHVEDDVKVVFEQVFVGKSKLDAFKLVHVVQESSGESNKKQLQVFEEFGKRFCDVLARRMGHWADFCDPCSGLPMVYQGSNNADSVMRAMEKGPGFHTTLFGSSGANLEHPEWGANFYAATIFTDAPKKQIESVLAFLDEKSIAPPPAPLRADASPQLPGHPPGCGCGFHNLPRHPWFAAQEEEEKKKRAPEA